MYHTEKNITKLQNYKFFFILFYKRIVRKTDMDSILPIEMDVTVTAAD